MPEVAKMKRNIPTLIKQGALTGLGFGFAICIVHLAMGIAIILSMGQPPMTWFAAKTLFIEIPLAAAFGVLFSPVRLIRRGALLQPLALGLLWIAMERYVAVDPSKLQMWALPTVVALLLYFGFRWVWQRKRLVVVLVCALTPAVILALPIISYDIRGGYDVKKVEKAKAPPKGAPDVVFIVLDTVRAHNVSAYGYERKTTPIFDAFSNEGVLFENATAPGTWSLASHAALFTGALPSINGAHAESRYLNDAMPTLAQALAENGYETRCFTANPHITPGFGLTRGFGWSDNAWITGAGGRGFTFIYRLVDALGITNAKDKGGEMVARNVADWMKQRPKDGPPAFVFVNFLEAHFPFHQLPDEYRYKYTSESLSNLRSYGQIAFGAQIGRLLTPEEHKRIRQPILDLYDGGILYTDHLMGEVIDIWRQRGELDDTLFVVMADHGEHVGEHKMYGHMSSVYQEDLWVPFMIRYPEKIKAGSRVSQEVTTMGAFATIFDLLDLDLPKSVQVGSLMPGLEPVAEGEERAAFGRPVISERFEEALFSSRFEPGTANGEGPLLIPWGRYRTYRTGSLKLAEHFQDGKFSYHLFDLEKDPSEMTDLAQDPGYQDTVKQLKQELRNWSIVDKIPPLDGKVDAAAAGDSKLSDEAKEQLKALGYME